MSMENQRKTIGIYVSNLEDDFTNAFCKGAISAAEKQDQNVVIFPGKYLGIDYGYDSAQLYEYQYNTLFSYATKEGFDALILCIGTFGYMLQENQINVFVEQFRDIPILTVASKIKDLPAIYYDNRKGLKEAIEFLITVQKKTKIGFIAGPKGNYDAKERYQVYIDTLNEYQIDPVEERIVYGDFTKRCSTQVHALLDNNPDLEVIICANDDTALGVYDALKERRLEIGKDILVVGFDDIPSAGKLNPPLATVRADAVELGYHAFVNTLNMLDGYSSEISYVDTTFIYRASAGTLPCSLSTSMKYLVSQHSNDSQEFKAAELIRNEFINLNHVTNILSRDMLMLSDESEQNFASLLANLYMLDIHSSYLYIYPEPIINSPKDTWKLPKTILFKSFQHNRDVYSVPRIKQKMNTRHIFSHPYIATGERFALVACDIYSQDKQFGIFLCDIKHSLFHYVELLTYQISAAVKMIHLLQTQKRISAEMEARNEILYNNNIMLDTISRSDELTGLLNRRGFFQEANRCLRMEDTIGKHILVFYADTNKLKNINDTYGHDEGDYALKASANILKTVFGTIGIIGRIGGDEFAGIAVLAQSGREASLRHQLSELTEKINRTSNKPYSISLSIGICEYEFSPKLQLNDLLDQADDLLYIEKQNR